MNNNSLALKLPEILFHVTNHLALDYDDNSLYNCMLVNRSWCLVSAQLLWARPFRTSTKNSDFKIIEIYLRFLNYEKYRYYISNNSDRPPLINYYLFLSEIDFHELYLRSSKWISFHCSSQNVINVRSQFLKVNLTYILWSFFLNNCTRITDLHFDNTIFESDNDSTELFGSNKYESFINLKRVNCTGKVDSLLKFLNINCNHIREFNISLLDFGVNSDLVASLILSQSYLQIFICRNNSSNFISFFDATLILDSLISYNNYTNGSLLHIEFMRCHFETKVTLCKLSFFDNIDIKLIDCWSEYNWIDMQFVSKIMTVC